MVAQMKADARQSWQQGEGHPTAMTHVTLFILLAVRQAERLVDLSPTVEAKVFWAADLDGARQQAQAMLQHDARIDHVSVLDGQGHGVLTVVRRVPAEPWRTARSSTLRPMRAPSRQAFH